MSDDVGAVSVEKTVCNAGGRLKSVPCTANVAIQTEAVNVIADPVAKTMTMMRVMGVQTTTTNLHIGNERSNHQCLATL